MKDAGSPAVALTGPVRAAVAERLGRTDLAIGAGLVLLTLASRVPLWRDYLFNWDAANFALAVLHFDVREHRPHPPGYFYFVALGWVVNLALHDPPRSLTLVSTLLSAGAVLATYLVGRTVAGGRAAGVAAAVLLLTSVTFWAYGLVGLAYPALAFFGALVSLAAFGGRPLLASAALGVGSGFRPDLVLLLGPLWVWSLRRAAWPRRLAAIVLLGGLGLGWLVPTVVLSGGVSGYFQALGGYFEHDVWQRYAPGARGPAALGVNIRDTAAYVFYGLYFTAVPLAAGLLQLGRDLRRRGRGLRVAGCLALWAGPPLAFYTLVHIGDPGYIFSFLPALTVSAAWGLGIAGDRRVFWAGLVAVALLNAAVFFFHPRLLTYPGLVAADASFGDRLGLLDRFAPDSTLVVAAESYRALQFYRPAYRTVWVDRRSPEETPVEIPPGVRQVVLFDPGLKGPAGTRVQGRTASLDVVPVQPGDVLTVWP